MAGLDCDPHMYERASYFGFSESLALMRVQVTWAFTWERSQGSSEMRRISSVCEFKAWYVNEFDSIVKTLAKRSAAPYLDERCVLNVMMLILGDDGVVEERLELPYPIGSSSHVLGLVALSLWATHN